MFQLGDLDIEWVESLCVLHSFFAALFRSFSDGAEDRFFSDVFDLERDIPASERAARNSLSRLAIIIKQWSTT